MGGGGHLIGKAEFEYIPKSEMNVTENLMHFAP